jgi:hypothetical protein
MARLRCDGDEVALNSGTGFGRRGLDRTIVWTMNSWSLWLTAMHCGLEARACVKEDRGKGADIQRSSVRTWRD